MIKGQNVILQCEVYGNPAPNVSWTKDGEAVNITDQRISVSLTGNTSSLTIVSVVQADQGLYRCVANNSVNTVTSSPGTLVIHCEFLIIAIVVCTYHVSIRQDHSLVNVSSIYAM